jgi:hypothetical protein
MLPEEESERLWIRVDRVEQEHVGALLLTDRRLLFSGLGFFSQSQEGWPLSVVEDVAAHGDRLTLRVLGLPEAFSGKPRDVSALAEALGPREATDPVGQRSLPEQLERLGALHDSGVLNDDEFRVAKRRLLE